MKSVIQTYYEFLRIENEINVGKIIDDVKKNLIKMIISVYITCKQ